MARKYGRSLNAPINQPKFATTPGGKRIARVVANRVSGGGSQTCTDSEAKRKEGAWPGVGTGQPRR